MTETQAIIKAKKAGAPAGNRNAERHGLYATRTGHALRARRLRRLVGRVYRALPWLDPVADVAAVRAWCDLELKVGEVSAYLESVGTVNANGEPRRLLGELRSLMALQLQFAKELGMTPAARAMLRVDSLRGDDLATQLANIQRGASH